MNGLLYKNLIQSRLIFILTALLYPVLLILFLFVTSFRESGFSIKEACTEIAENGVIITAFLFMFIPLITSFFHMSVVSNDEMKKWAYFVTSTPDGIQNQIYYKYVTVFMLIGLSYAVGYMSAMVFESFVSEISGQQITSIVGILGIVFYLQLFVDAFDIPFVIRFGQKVGERVKTGSFIGLIVIFFIYILFGPLPENLDDVIEKIYDIIVGIMNGSSNDTIIFITGLFPIISIISYVLSFKISCRMYLKGADMYEK